MQVDVSPFLEWIRLVPDAVMKYWELNAKCLKQNKLCNDFWEPPNNGHDQIVRWFQSDAINQICASEDGNGM